MSTSEKIVNLDVQRARKELEELIELPVVKYGEKVIRSLTDKEIIDYHELYLLQDRISSGANEMYREAISKLIDSGFMLDPATQDKLLGFDSREQANVFMKDATEHRLKFTNFWWSIRLELNDFIHALGVRDGFVLIRGNLKYRIADEP